MSAMVFGGCNALLGDAALLLCDSVTFACLFSARIYRDFPLFYLRPSILDIVLSPAYRNMSIILITNSA